ncbi:MAG: enolase [candidate division Zixibacteria bacterium]|nr:enolase [candidate division Zixibacteria bacterium]
MKVTGVERIVVDVPFTDRQIRITEREVYNWAILELCKVTTDAGITGWGETVIHYTWARVTDAAVERVVGKSPADMMNDDSLGAGLQMALFDVVGKALGVPCYKLMGHKVRDWVPISWWSIDASPEDWAEEAKDAVALGYTSFKIKQRPWWDIFAQVEAMAAVTPSYFKLDLDANATMQNAAAAMPIMRRLEQFPNVAMFESPIPQSDILGNRQLRQVICRPIAMHFGSPPYLTAVREEVCDGFVVCAGKTAVIRQGTLSAEANMPFWLQLVGNGLTTTWAGHLGAVLSHATWPAITCVNLYSHQLLTKPIEVVGGYHRVPEAPGLGVVVDEAAVERYRIPDTKIQELNKEGKLYDRPQPRIVCSTVYPDGSRIHLAPMHQGYGYFSQGHGPAHVDGVRLEPYHDDGTQEWADLFERAKQHPVRSLG